MPAPLLLTLLLAAAPRAAAPGAVPPTYLATPPSRTATGRAAYGFTRDADRKPVLQAWAFLLARVLFSRADNPERWPSLCDMFWNWNEATHRFERGAAASAYLSGTPNCAFRGTVYLKGELMPRTAWLPGLAVAVEGPEGSLPLPVRTFLDGRTSGEWSGVPVFLGAIATTEFDDGVHRLRVTGGWRELEVDGDPATTEFEEGGDATVAFLVQNGPPRLRELVVRAGAATVYTGGWRWTPGGIERAEAGGTLTGTGRAVAVTMRFTVPVTGVRLVLRRDGGGRVEPAAPRPADPDGLEWTAVVEPGRLRAGAWTLAVTASDAEGHGLQAPSGDAVTRVDLPVIDPDSGACLDRGLPCRPAEDASHRLAVVTAPSAAPAARPPGHATP